jgi:hypothetical protein
VTTTRDAGDGRAGSARESRDGRQGGAGRGGRDDRADRDDWEARRVRPNGLEVRRRRHARGWAHRELLDAIREASRAATGVPATISPDQLKGIEEENELVPYATLCLVASGLDCDPIDLLGV